MPLTVTSGSSFLSIRKYCGTNNPKLITIFMAVFAVYEFACGVLWNCCFCIVLLFSVVFGWVATIIPRAYTYYISTALFAIFGLKMLKEGYYMSPNEAQEEFEEVQSDLRKREDEV